MFGRRKIEALTSALASANRLLDSAHTGWRVTLNQRDKLERELAEERARHARTKEWLEKFQASTSSLIVAGMRLQNEVKRLRENDDLVCDYHGHSGCNCDRSTWVLRSTWRKP